MKHVWAFGIVWLASVPASAQVSDRLEVGAIARTDRVSFEGGQHATLPVTGVGFGYRIWRDMRIEGEVTAAAGESTRSYEGDFISYAGPGATRDEIQRMAVIARRTTTNKAGLGFAMAVSAQTRQPGRVNLGARAGISVRQYHYLEETTVLRVPDGVTIAQAESAMPDGRGGRARSGLLLGASMPVRITGRLHVVPEVRWVWGGPARVGNNYDEGTVGGRVVWRF